MLIGAVSQVAVDIGAHGFVTTSACNSEAFLRSSACSKDGGDGSCLKNEILELGNPRLVSVLPSGVARVVSTLRLVSNIYLCTKSE